MPVELPSPVESYREATGQRRSLQHDYSGASATTAPLPERTSA